MYNESYFECNNEFHKSYFMESVMKQKSHVLCPLILHFLMLGALGICLCPSVKYHETALLRFV